MSALGSRAAISDAEVVPGTISENTPASRTRRAMSWVYCEPKSRINTRSRAVRPPRRRACRAPDSIATVISLSPYRSQLMAKHSAVGEHHGDSALVTSADHLGIAHRASGLNHRRHAGLGGVDDVVREREESVRGQPRPANVVAGAPRLQQRHVHGIDPTGLAGTQPDQSGSTGDRDRVRARPRDHGPGEA